LAYEILVDHALPSDEHPEKLRLGWVKPSAFGPIEPAIERDLLQLLGLAGFSPTPVIVEEGSTLFEIFTAIQSPEAYFAHIDDLREGLGLIDDEVGRRLQNGANVPAWKYLHAMDERESFRHKVHALFDTFDLLVMPTTPTVAPQIGERSPRVNGVVVEVRSALLSLTSPWNLLGLPALSLPAGMLADLPFGLQLIGRAGSEGKIFDLARIIESSIHDHAS